MILLLQRHSSVVIVGRPGQEIVSMQPQLQARFIPNQEPAVLRGNEIASSLPANARFQQQPTERGMTVGWPGTQVRVPPLPLSHVGHAARGRSVPGNSGDRNMYGWGPGPGVAAGAAGLPIDSRDSRRLYSSSGGNSRRSMHLAGAWGPGLDRVSAPRGSSIANAESLAVPRKQGPAGSRISRSLSPGRRQALASTAATLTASGRRGGRGNHAAALASIYLDQLNDGLPKQFMSHRSVTQLEQQPSREDSLDLPKEPFQGGGRRSSRGVGGRGGPGQNEFMDRRSTQDRRFGPGSPR